MTDTTTSATLPATKEAPKTRELGWFERKGKETTEFITKKSVTEYGWKESLLWFLVGVAGLLALLLFIKWIVKWVKEVSYMSTSQALAGQTSGSDTSSSTTSSDTSGSSGSSG